MPPHNGINLERLPVDAFRVSNEELYALVSAMSDQVASLCVLVESLSESVTELHRSHIEIRDLVRKYGDDIRPTIDALSNSPIARFLGVK